MSEYIIECEYDSDEGWIPGEHREEIVRCRDCKYLVDDDSVWVCDGFCANIGFNDGTPPDGFCSWGERREP